MAAEIGPGTLLECIAGAPSVNFPHIRVVTGSVYRCVRVEVSEADPRFGPCRFCGLEPCVGVIVEGDDSPGRWCAKRFRPLPPRSKFVDALLEKLKAPAKVPESA